MTRDRTVIAGPSFALPAHVSNARAICEGDIQFFTRYTHGGENRLRGDRETNNAIGYLLAVFTEQHNIELNAISYLGTHEHGLGCDVEGRIPDFFRDLHANITKTLNAIFGDHGSMWDSRQTSLVRAVTPDDVVGRVAYIAANPVKHQLVKFAKNHPGFKMSWPCRPKRFKRPKGLDPNAKNPDGTLKWPPEATLTVHRPRGFEDLSDADLAVLLHEACRAQEDAFREEVAARDGRFLGRHNVKKQSRYWRASGERQRRREISPTIACRDPELRKAELAKRKVWLNLYAERLARFRRGERDVEFPVGTFKMRRVYGVRVASPPT